MDAPTAVQLQADAAYRAKPEDLGKVYVRTVGGAMVPVSTLIKVKSVVGAELLERFNGFLAAKVLGNPFPKVSTGDAIKIVEEVAKETLPPAMNSPGPVRPSRRSAPEPPLPSPSVSASSWSS